MRVCISKNIVVLDKSVVILEKAGCGMLMAY